MQKFLVSQAGLPQILSHLDICPGLLPPGHFFLFMKSGYGAGSFTSLDPQLFLRFCFFIFSSQLGKIFQGSLVHCAHVLMLGYGSLISSFKKGRGKRNDLCHHDVMSLLNISLNSHRYHFFLTVVRTLEIYSLTKFPVYDPLLLTIVTIFPFTPATQPLMSTVNNAAKNMGMQIYIYL